MSDTPTCDYCQKAIELPDNVLAPFGLYHDECYVRRTARLIEACNPDEEVDTVRETVPTMNVYKVCYRVPINGVYLPSDKFCHVRATCEQDAIEQVGNLIERNSPMLDKLGLVFTSIREENYVWLDEVISKYDDLDILRKDLMSAALGGYINYFHKESSTHILYVPWLKPLIVRGVSEDVHKAYEILKEGVESLMGDADFENLNRWKHQYQDWCREHG